MVANISARSSNSYVLQQENHNRRFAAGGPQHASLIPARAGAVKASASAQPLVFRHCSACLRRWELLNRWSPAASDERPFKMHQSWKVAAAPRSASLLDTIDRL